MVEVERSLGLIDWPVETAGMGSIENMKMIIDIVFSLICKQQLYLIYPLAGCVKLWGF